MIERNSFFTVLLITAGCFLYFRTGVNQGFDLASNNSMQTYAQPSDDCLKIPENLKSGLFQGEFIKHENSSVAVKLCYNPDPLGRQLGEAHGYYNYSFIVVGGRDVLEGVSGCSNRVYFFENPADLDMYRINERARFLQFRRKDDGKLLTQVYDEQSLRDRGMFKIIVSSSNGLISEYVCIDRFWYVNRYV